MVFLNNANTIFMISFVSILMDNYNYNHTTLNID